MVTGASSGIGAATAAEFAASGAQVVLVARSAERLEARTEDIKRSGGAAGTYQADLSNSEAVGELAAKVRRDVGVPDILVNNAGSGRWAPLIDTSADELRRMIELPYLAAAYTSRAFLPDMIARGSGKIACVTSPASYLAWRDACGYIAARHALKGFAEGLRADLKGTGLHVTLVVLGAVDTPYWANNPGSRASVPKTIPGIFPQLTVRQAASAIVDGIERKQRVVVKPAAYRLVFAMQALAPSLVARGIRIVSKRAEAPHNPS
jgi:short-subunit dehydrogenase